jgi:hypothetical protein
MSDAAFYLLHGAKNDYAESDARLARAGELAAAVASVAPPVKAATAQDPSLGESLRQAEKDFNEALYGLEQDGLEQVQAAAWELRNTWAVARYDAREAGNTELQKACDVGFAIAEGIFQAVNDPAFVKAQKSR